MARGAMPPDELMIRIGVSPEWFPTREARERFYEQGGRAAYECVRGLVPHKHEQAILDFGCGTGRVLRWFAAEPELRLSGCDVHAPSIDWMQRNFDPAMRLYVNEPRPPLPETDDAFDLVYCGSVFSHLTEWAPWLLELRRVLKPGGALVASLHGRGFWSMGLHGTRGVPWDEEGTGLLVEYYGSKFEDSWGPAVYVSEWWVREHWGRAFAIERYQPAGFAQPDDQETGQAWLLARKPLGGGSLTPADLEAPSTDPREAKAALRGQQLAYEEVAELIYGQSQRLQALGAQLANLTHRLAAVESSKSWALTRPLRGVARWLRAGR